METRVGTPSEPRHYPSTSKYGYTAKRAVAVCGPAARSRSGNVRMPLPPSPAPRTPRTSINDTVPVPDMRLRLEGVLPAWLGGPLRGGVPAGESCSDTPPLPTPSRASPGALRAQQRMQVSRGTWDTWLVWWCVILKRRGTTAAALLILHEGPRAGASMQDTACFSALCSATDAQGSHA